MNIFVWNCLKSQRKKKFFFSHFFTFEVPFNGHFAPISRNRMYNIFRDSESLGKSNGNKWPNIWTFLFGSGLTLPRKKKYFFLLILPWSTLLWHRCYYPHRSRDALSPVCRIFCKTVLIDLSPRGCGSWSKIAVFQIHVNYFLFWQNKNFWKLILPQHSTCWILFDFDLHLDYFIMQNFPVTREWDEANWPNPLISTVFGTGIFTAVATKLITSNVPNCTLPWPG